MNVDPRMAILFLVLILAGAACSDSRGLQNLEQRVDEMESQEFDSQNEIEDLKSKIDELESEIADLHQMVDEAQSTADDARSMAEEANSCAEDVSRALNSLTFDDLRFGYGASTFC